MDIGHVRNLTWAKDNDSAKWVAYNRLRGQYMSALEHAVPERFFNDPAQCNLQGTTSPITGLPDCPQGISAVKALGLAAAQGQKIYTITQKVYKDNPTIVSTALSAHSQSTRQKVQESLDAGLEVTIHERPITESGWTGAGYTVIDTSTGAGAYLIDGGSNGAIYIAVGVLFLVLAGVTLWMSGGLAGAIAANVVGQEIAAGLGFIAIGIGKILGNQDLVNAGAVIALGGLGALAMGLQLVSAAFGFLSLSAIGITGFFQLIISTIFPR